LTRLEIVIANGCPRIEPKSNACSSIGLIGVVPRIEVYKFYFAKWETESKSRNEAYVLSTISHCLAFLNLWYGCLAKAKCILKSSGLKKALTSFKVGGSGVLSYGILIGLGDACPEVRVIMVVPALEYGIAVGTRARCHKRYTFERKRKP
jgi:hypothetical protein